MEIKQPTIYSPDRESLIRNGFEERCEGEEYAWWELWMEIDKIYVQYYPQKKSWQIGSHLFYPETEVQLKTILRCLIKPSTVIQ